MLSLRAVRSRRRSPPTGWRLDDGLFAGADVPTRKAHRVIKARRIIRHAYGRRRANQAIRFELLGDVVAVAVVRHMSDTSEVAIKVARELPDGRASRMLKESTLGFASVREQIRYFESLYERYGSPE